jgi:hypothetical protein
MKHVTGILFEEGDHVLITTGYHKGKLAMVTDHSDPQDDVGYELVDGSDADCSLPEYLKYLTPEEASALMDKMKI